LEDVRAVSGSTDTPTATVSVKKDGKIETATSEGDGPVDACYKAIDQITGLSPSLLDYALKAVTGGKEALGEVSVRIELSGQAFSGRGASTDIIEASAKAYVRAINRFMTASGNGG
jgi:2-isopropylmalate synthase